MEYERELLQRIGPSLRGPQGGKRMIAELKRRAAAGDRLAPQFIDFYAHPAPPRHTTAGGTTSRCWW
jgi:hypothetical protein